MTKIISAFIFSSILFYTTSFGTGTVPYPTIFVHGIGDASVAWKVTGPSLSSYDEKYYKTDFHPYFKAGSGIGGNRDDKNFSDNLRNSCIYATFADYYASPANQVVELEKIIEDSRQEVWDNFPDYFGSKEKIKVNLVAHSIGGLVCRKYITQHLQDHKVAAFITIDTPNTGTRGLKLKWMPYIFEVGGVLGALAFSSPLLLSLTAAGVGADILLHQYGIRLLSPAADSMHPDSNFLKELNRLNLPEDIKYRAIISDSSTLPQQASNFLLGFKNGGDGAISIESQSLKSAGIPNFERLDYAEYMIDSPHFEAFTKAAPKIIEILNLN